MKQLLCYGDSNTWGLIPGTLNRYPWGVRWTSLLQEKLYPHEWRVLEEGLCGRTTAHEDPYRENRNGSKLLPAILETHRPIDAAVIMLGTNDCKTHYSLTAKQIAAGLERCVEQLSEDVPPERILIVAPIHIGSEIWKPEFDPEFDSASIDRALQLKEYYSALARRRGMHMIAASDLALPSAIDQEHMDERGHAAFAEAIYDALITRRII